jgi:NagD protein
MSRHGFLIDMDGVIYRGGNVIDGAIDFIDALRRQDIPFLFLTNNSQRTRRDIATKLKRMGFNVEDRHIFTCAIATARFLSMQKPEGTAFVIGEGGLLQALHVNGYSIVDSHPDYVVVGEGRTLNMEVMEAAVNMIVGGARLIATNLDPNCPTSTGMRPGCGATVAMLETAACTKAFTVGKPSPIMMREACKELGLHSAEITMIGDTMDTDVLGGVGIGFKTVLVLSGVTAYQDLQAFPYQPDAVCASIADCLLPEFITSGDPAVLNAQQAKNLTKAIGYMQAV